MAWLTARALTRKGITRMSGSSAKPIRCTKPSPQRPALDGDDRVALPETGVGRRRATVERLDDSRRRHLRVQGIRPLDQRTDPAVLERGDDPLVDLGEGPAVVETRLDEVGAD